MNLAALAAFAGFELRAPGWLALAALLPLAWWLRRRRGRPAIAFAPSVLLAGPLPLPEPGAPPPEPPLPRTWRQRLLFLPGLLHGVGLLLAIVALARPVQRTPLPETQEALDIVLCLDVSSSMEANDLAPDRTRLAVAKDAAARFIARRRGDRIGLVCFARYPDLRCPPTLDHRALGEILAEVDLVESDTQEDATGIGTALARAAQVLQGSAAPAKVVVLLSDGEENVATVQTPDEIMPLHAAQLCRELGVRAYAIAAGAQERLPDGTVRQLDTSGLARIAAHTGGRFWKAPDAATLDEVYAEVDTLERAPLAAPRYRVEERFLPVLLCGLGLLLLGRLLRAAGLVVLP